MDAKTHAQQQIAQLVSKFHETPKKDRKSYNEQETRLAWILPLFRALGWDIENRHEVSAEEQISRGFVDFGFYLNQIPVFYLETKRITEKLDKSDSMLQSINYAYLRGVTWAVLTDFERLMVFNAEWEERDPLKARFLDLHYEDYAETRFDDLWLLSKTMMSQVPRPIDQFAERVHKKARKQPVTERLFADLTGWRRTLFNNIRQLESVDSHRVDNAVQKFFDRLIFIRAMEDRGVESPQLEPLIRQTTKAADLFPNLLKLFRELDGVYNSNLFAPHDLDQMQVHDVGLIKEIINGLYKTASTRRPAA
ncbi:MAG: hypothetical protein MUF87_08945 [Anaerolineae bacterium]|nr:hypothetical protein [Anaerolineae bacterium]